MDLRRVRTYEWLTGLAGVALLVSLFVPWYSAQGTAANAWQSFAIVDVILALAAVAAIALPLLAATQRTTAVPQGMTAWVVIVGFPAAVLAIIRLLAVPDLSARPGTVTRDAGVWIGAVAMLAILALDWRSMGDKRFPRAMRPRLEVQVVRAPGPDGERRDSQ